MTDSRFFIILNPAAARGRAARTWRAAAHVLEQAGAHYELVHTDGPRHAEQLAQAAIAEGYQKVVAVGGDGTVQEVANGLVRAANGGPTVPMGIIGLGSGNDFIKLLGLPGSRPAEAARRLLTAQPRTVDIGLVGNRYFTNGVGIGFDSRVAVEARKIRRLRGFAIYALAVAKTLRTHRTPCMRVVIDGEQVAERDVTLVTVSNGACHGGAFWLCPQARLDDGLLDICIADALSAVGVVKVIPSLMRGTHLSHPAVRMYRGRQVHITSAEPLPVHADGEILYEGAQELEIEILPRQLTVLA